jgi:peptidoglycan-N-acetylglucosamine deacetylase
MNQRYSFDPIGPTAPANVVLLTFDDGPSEVGLLTSMLDVLDKHDAKAIFFVNGYRAQPHPELLTLIAGRGHTIGNHSWDHVNLKELDADEVAQQIGDVQSLVAQTVGTAPRFFRPPFGAGSEVVEQIAADNGLLYMTWSDGSLDWDASTQGRPDLVVANVLGQLHPGANILMHELPRTAEALDPLLTQLEQRGYGFIDPATIE